jgi:hypothetical protein
MTQPDRSLEQWARTADLPDPPRWGEVEAVILAEPVTQDDLDEVPPPPGRGARLVGALVSVVVGILVAASYTSSLAGLALVLWRTGAAVTVPEEWVHWPRIAFLVACGVSGATFGVWRSTRRRGVLGPVATAVTGTVSLVALVVMLSRPELFDDILLRVLAGLAAALGIATCAVVLTASKPGVPRRSRARRRQDTPEDQVRRGMRAQVLEILVRRGVVSDRQIDVPDMVGMPIGSWHELDEPRRPEVP